jgi:signal transduction histidine kinase
VKELAEAMEGSVTVESVVGRGATFVVRLPVRDDAQRGVA